MENKISLENVKSVYSGKSNHCCCGCSGTHKTQEESLRFVKMALKKVNTVFAADPEKIEVTQTYIAWDNGSRIYIVYLND